MNIPTSIIVDTLSSLTRNPEYQSICPVMKSNYANEKPVKQSTIDVVSTNGEAYDVKA